MAGVPPYKEAFIKHPPLYVLQSFIYAQDWQMQEYKKGRYKLFLLDSGAFTFMAKAKKTGAAADFDKYLDEYIAFINKWDVKLFFELDIDDIVGYETVKRMRKKLEQKTGKSAFRFGTKAGA